MNQFIGIMILLVLYNFILTSNRVFTSRRGVVTIHCRTNLISWPMFLPSVHIILYNKSLKSVLFRFKTKFYNQAFVSLKYFDRKFNQILLRNFSFFSSIEVGRRYFSFNFLIFYEMRTYFRTGIIIFLDRKKVCQANFFLFKN